MRQEVLFSQTISIKFILIHVHIELLQSLWNEMIHTGHKAYIMNSLLVKRQIDNPSPGAVTGGNQSLALTREVILDTLSSDSSEEEIRDSGRPFQSLIVWGKKLYI